MPECLKIDNDAHMEQWDDFVASHPNGTPFHLSYWLKTIHSVFKYEPLLFAFKEQNGELSGVFPCFKIKSFLTGGRIVSLPFSDYGGPLLKDEKQIDTQLNLALEAYKNSVGYIEVRSDLPQSTFFECYKYFLRHVLVLEKELNKLKSKINKRTILYSVRKSFKKGVRIQRDNTLKGIEGFYRLYKQTRTKHGIPPQSKAFFDSLFSNAIQKGHGFIKLAYKDSKPIAASIFLLCNNKIHYKYNVSDPECVKQYSPNHLLTFSAIMDGWKDGYQVMDFGRSAQDNEGLIRYKEMWGAEKTDLPYYFYPDVKGAGSKGHNQLSYRLMTAGWRFLPDKVTEKIGPTIMKHLA